jgi:hypothetical protein
MKKKTESSLEEIIHYYGSLEAYNEEQRRCGMVTIETAMRANPFIQQIRIEQARPIEMTEVQPEPRRFLFKFFGFFGQKV